MIDYTGLRKRPTFEGFVDYLANKQERVRYPDRFAKQIREHPYLTQLDGEGLLEIEEMDRKRAEQEYMERTARQFANQNNVSAQVARAVAQPPPPPPPAPAPARARTSEAGSQARPQGTEAGTQARPQGTEAGTQSERMVGRTTEVQTQFTGGDIDQLLDAVQREMQQRVEAERRAREARDRATAERLTAVNLTGVRSGEGVVGQMMDVGPNTGDKRESDTTGLSPPRAKAKATVSEGVVIYSPKAKAKASAPASASSSASASASASSSSAPAVKGPNISQFKVTFGDPNKAPKMNPSSSSPDPKQSPKPKAKAKGVKKDSGHTKQTQQGVGLIDKTDVAWWEKQNRTLLTTQLGLRGDRNPKALAKKNRKQLAEMLVELIKRDKK